jgi:hypothetical protein
VQAKLLERVIDDPAHGLGSEALTPPARIERNAELRRPVLADAAVQHDLTDEAVLVGGVVGRTDTFALCRGHFALDDELPVGQT